MRTLWIGTIAMLVLCDSVRAGNVEGRDDLGKYRSVYETSAASNGNRYIFVRGKLNIGFEKSTLSDIGHQRLYEADLQDWMNGGRSDGSKLGRYCLSVINIDEFYRNRALIRRLDGKEVVLKAYFVKDYRDVNGIAAGDCEFSPSGVLIDIGSIRAVR